MATVATRIGRVALALGALAAAGCQSLAPLREAPPEAVVEIAVVPGVSGARLWGDDLDADLLGSLRRGLRDRLAEEWRRKGMPAAGLDHAILALSGGGPDGAFAAGLLNGWTETGRRPEFHTVTGISVGALIAPFAFAGPAYDPVLQAIFTEFGQADVANLAIFSALRGALGVADTSPLRAHIRHFVDKPFIGRIAELHREGRRLLIGTTNIDAGRPVLWDMGAIAAAGQVTLFQDVMLASASIPGAFPPVGIDVRAKGQTFTEFHVDGGVTQSVFLGPPGLALAVPDDLPFPIRRTIFVIQNNSLTPPYIPVESRLTAIASRSLSTLIRSQSQGDLARIFVFARDIGAEFQMAFVPAGFGAATATSFDPVYMRELFEASRDLARSGVDWLPAPPGVATRSQIIAEMDARLPPVR